MSFDEYIDARVLLEKGREALRHRRFTIVCVTFAVFAFTVSVAVTSFMCPVPFASRV
jgi:hypothetical protein